MNPLLRLFRRSYVEADREIAIAADWGHIPDFLIRYNPNGTSYIEYLRPCPCGDPGDCGNHTLQPPPSNTKSLEIGT